MTSSLLVIVPGFGVPYLDEKKRFLRHNITVIRSTFEGRIVVRIFNYSHSTHGLVGLEMEGVEIVETAEAGIIGQFMYRHLPAAVVCSEFDHIMLMLDDITLDPQTNITDLIQYQLHANYDVLSPSLTPHSMLSHGIMVQRFDMAGCTRRTNFLELFLYLMTPAAYEKYLSLFDDDTAWTWGLDLCLHVQGFRLGIVDRWPITHHFKQSTYSPDKPCPWHEMNRMIAKYGRVHGFHDLEKIPIPGSS